MVGSETLQPSQAGQCTFRQRRLARPKNSSQETGCKDCVAVAVLTKTGGKLPMNDDVSVSSYRGGKVRVERDVQGVVPVHSWVIESAGTDVGSKLKRKKVN